MSTLPILRVALDAPLPRLFDYLCADARPDDVGYRVSIPFGRSEKVGLIVAVLDESDQTVDKLKHAHAVLRDMPHLPADWIALCEFCARYYQYPLGEVMALALPPMLRKGKLPRKLKDKPLQDAGVVQRPTLHAEQQAAYAAIDSATGKFQPFLLHGITGSGKTEVYLHAIEAVLARGQQALMLVPEIALTPQLEGRVAARFPNARFSQSQIEIRSRGAFDEAVERGIVESGPPLGQFRRPRLNALLLRCAPGCGNCRIRLSVVRPDGARGARENCRHSYHGPEVIQCFWAHFFSYVSSKKLPR